MAKRVLGDDPFSNDKRDDASKPPAKSAAPKKSDPPVSAKGRKSLPPAKPAKSVPPRRSKAPPPPEESVAEALPEVPPPAPVPVLEAPAETVEDPSDDALGSADAPPSMATAEEVATSDAPRPAEENLEDALRDLEARLDKLLHATRSSGEETAQPLIDRVASRLRAAVHEAPPRADGSGERDEQAFDISRELLSSEYYIRQWGRVAMRDRSEEVDEFGYDPAADARWRTLFDVLYERWWRVEVTGIEHVPAEGRVALVANHSGAVPYDGIMLAAALRKEHPSARQLRWLAEDFVFHLPFVGAYLTRLGAVRACQENAERLLQGEACVGMFPEGLKGVSKLYRDRYRLQRFGRGGHIKLAIRTRTPLIPVAIIGAEETHPLLAPGGMFARMLGVPYVPVTPTFPLFGALGLVPLPSKWKIAFGEPIPMDGYGPDAADDEVLVGRLNEKLRSTIQEMLDRGLRARRSVFSG